MSVSGSQYCIKYFVKDFSYSSFKKKFVVISLVTLTLIVFVWEPSASSQVHVRYVLNISRFRILSRWPNNVIGYCATVNFCGAALFEHHIPFWHYVIFLLCNP